jgi:hypothetical protein
MDFILSRWGIVSGVLAIFCLSVLAERIHARRVRRVARLAFGPSGEARKWVKAVPLLRVLCLSGMGWGLLSLLAITGTETQSGDTKVKAGEQLVILVDVSPSMGIKDAGPKGEQTRSERLGDVMDALLARLGNQVRYSVLCFYTRTIPLARQVRDKSVVANVFNDLPIEKVMKPGKTDLIAAVKKTLDFIDDYPRNSVTLLVCSDGDSVPLGSIGRELPASISKVMVLGVGSPVEGTAIDGHLSRQDKQVLAEVGQRLQGKSFDVNSRQLSSSELKGLMYTGLLEKNAELGHQRLSLAVLAICAFCYVLLPVALDCCGSDWKVVNSVAI